MKKINVVRSIISLILISVAFLGFGFVFLHQSVMAFMNSTNLMFFDLELSAYFIFDLSITFIIFAFCILTGIIMFPVFEKIMIGGN